MKKFLYILLTFSLMPLCTSCDDDSELTEEKNLTGHYTLTEIHWTGLSVNLNRDNSASWDMIYEYKDQIGYYEPDYVLEVEKQDNKDKDRILRQAVYYIIYTTIF